MMMVFVVLGNYMGFCSGVVGLLYGLCIVCLLLRFLYFGIFLVCCIYYLFVWLLVIIKYFVMIIFINIFDVYILFIMLEYWKLIFKYWCKYCFVYVCDIKFECVNYEFMGKY